MAGAAPEAPLLVPSWAIALLFVCFLIFTLVWEKGLHALESRLRRRHRKGLLGVLRHLKDELLAVGIMSFLLSFADEGLQRICIPAAWSGAASAYAGGGLARRLLLGAAAAVAAPEGGGGDELAAAAEGGVVGESAVCPRGQLQLYPGEALHGTHLFLSLVAISHILTACASMTLCLWRLRRWAAFERAASASAALIIVSPRVMRSLGRTQAAHFCAALVNQFTMSVTQPVYAGVRRLFLEQLRRDAGASEPLPPASFPFLQLVEEAAEDNLSGVLGVSWWLWGFAVVHLAIPFPYRVWSFYALCSLALVLMVIAGAKLQSIVTHLAARAHIDHGNESIEAYAQRCCAEQEQEDEGTGGEKGGRDGGADEDDEEYDVFGDDGRDARHKNGNGSGSSGSRSATPATPSPLGKQQQQRPPAAALNPGSGGGGGSGSSPGGGGGGATFSRARTMLGTFARSLTVISPVGSIGSMGGAFATAGGRTATLARMRRQGRKAGGNAARSYGWAKSRMHAGDDFDSLFWFRRPRLLLLLYRLAFFECAFCLTVVIFGLWKPHSQFLPGPQAGEASRAQLAGFLAVFLLTLLVTLFQATAVLPVYALVSTASAKSVVRAGLMLERNLRHQQHEHDPARAARNAVLQLAVVSAFSSSAAAKLAANVHGGSQHGGGGGGVVPYPRHARGWAKVRWLVLSGAVRRYGEQQQQQQGARAVTVDVG